MRSYIGFVTNPTADTPGTLAYLHFDSGRYLIGNLAEGTTRACSEYGLGLRKVSGIFLTGRMCWDNVGGMLGTILGLADTKNAAAAEAAAVMAQKTKSDSVESSHAFVDDGERLHIHGSYNLKHVIATARRFIFRRGMPVEANEYRSPVEQVESSGREIPPSYADDRVVVWAMPIQPINASSPITPATFSSSQSPGRKRTFEEANEAGSTASDIPQHQNSQHNDHDTICGNIVQQMFDSNWQYDRLVPRKLADVRMPAQCFVKDSTSGQLTKYTGPMPGDDGPVPDITVHVREPWPGSNLKHLPDTMSSDESMCFIISNHKQRGKFLPQKAKELGVPKGQAWGQLTLGKSVQNADGQTITPDMVLEPSRPGNGCAFVELPAIDYIEPLLQRPEWTAPNICEGLGAIVWILGPGVGADARIRTFQERMSHVKHFVSSKDYTENHISLDRAANNAMRHHYVDSEIFPSLNSTTVTPAENLSKRGSLSSDLPLSLPVEPGLQLVLEPQIEVDDRFIKKNMDVQEVQQKINDECGSTQEISDLLKAVELSEQLIPKNEASAYDDVEVIVLGTGSSHPSAYRNVSGTLIRVPGWGSLLLDAGEGTLNTLRRMFTEQQLEEILTDLRLIWISHLHADHHLGFTSVLKAWLHNRTRYESLNGSLGDLSHERKLYLLSHEAMCRWIHEYSSVEDFDLSHVVTVATNPQFSSSSGEEINQMTSFATIPSSAGLATEIGFLDEVKLTQLNTVYVNHCHGAQAISITFPSGFKLSYSGDCRPSSLLASIGRNSDLLIHEATFEDTMRSEALAKKHSTSGEAIVVGSEMKAKAVLLTHFSQRYPTMPSLGVDTSQTMQRRPSVDLRNILESSDQSHSEANSADVNVENPIVTEEPLGQDHEETQVKPDVMTESGTRVNEDDPTTNNSSEVIDSRNIQRLLVESEMRVLFAFDYMQLKWKNIPTLIAKQPILRAIYDLEVGKDQGRPVEDTSGDKIQPKTPEKATKKRNQKQMREER